MVPRAEPQPVVRLWWQTDLLSKGELLALYPQALEAKNTPNSGKAGAQAWVRGDALMLREAFKNLVDNALKHGGGSAVEVTVRAAADPTIQAWQVEVADHGPGVPAADQARLFERFARGPGAAAGGAGLGLAIVQRVVASHGGQIAAANRTEGGWCITLILPAAPQPATPNSRENAS